MIESTGSSRERQPQPPPVVTGIAEVNGTRLYYEMAGEGTPLILLHAGIADCRMWDAQFHDFAAYYQVLRYDFRGFGQSARHTGPYSDMDDLYALMTFLGLDRAHLIGVSMGGNVALGFAVLHPAMTASLTLVAPGLSGYTAYTAPLARMAAQIEDAAKRGDLMTAVELTLRLWVDGPSRSPRAIDQVVRMRAHRMLADNAHTFTAPDLEVRLDPPQLARLGEVAAPTLILVGDKDVPDMLNIAETLLERIPGSVQRLIMPDVAHLPNMEKPAEFNQIVLTFLSSLSQG